MKKINLLLFFTVLFTILNAPGWAQNCDNDTEAPLVACEATFGVEISALTGEVILTTDDLLAGATDNCTSTLDFRLSTTGATTEPPPSTSVTITTPGVHYVTLWAIDDAGNWNNCWSEVTAFAECEEDTDPPVAVCENNLTAPLTGDPEMLTLAANYFDDGSYDLCSPIATYLVAFNGQSFNEASGSITFDAPGTYVVTLWVQDESGNQSNCESEITIISQDLCENDTDAPVVICEEMLTVEAGQTITAEDLNEGSYDFCSETLDFRVNLSGETNEPPAATSLTLLNAGDYLVTLWAIDEAGNWSRCWTEVQVVNNNPGNRISGFAFHDANGDCQHDPDELYLENWTVQVSPLVEGVGDVNDPAAVITTTTNASGYYLVELSEPYIFLIDSVEVQLVTPMNLAQNCPLTYHVSTAVFGQTEDLFKDFAVTLEEDCEALQVDIGAPFLRRCFESVYTVNYCNYGAITAEEVYVEVELDSFLSYVGSSIPFNAVEGQTYTFFVGNLLSGACGQFEIAVEVSCDATFGQTHCTTAQIFLTEPCDPLYLGPVIEVNGACDTTAEVIKFTITNVGEGDMNEAQNYLVVEDVIMYMEEPFQLDSEEQIEVNLPANGATYRLEAEQPEDYPWLNVTSATVEGCGQNENGEVTLGLVTAFSPNEAGAFVDIDCQENVSSFDPNDKQALPRGVGEAHLLRKNTDLEYKIRFQNTGTDTAFTVVVLDTLSEWLDLNSVRPGVSSHAYSFQVLEGRVLEFRFSDILLPDSTTNEPASNGFIEFSVKQRPNNPDGTRIENNAAIYFDYNEPVMTNTVFHTIGELFVTVSTEDVPDDTPTLKVYPNPFGDQAIIELPEPTQGVFEVYNLQGQVVYRTAFAGKQIRLDAANLPGMGVFAYVLRDQAGSVYRGKIVVSVE